MALFWGHPVYNVFRTTTTAMHGTHWKNIFANLRTLPPCTHCPLVFQNCQLLISHPIDTEDIIVLAGRGHEIREGFIEKAVWSCALKDGQGPLSLTGEKGRSERSNNMNKTMNTVEQWFLKCDLQTSSISIS